MKKADYVEEEQMSLLPEDSMISQDSEKQVETSHARCKAFGRLSLLLKAALILGAFGLASALVLSIRLRPETCLFQFPEGSYCQYHSRVNDAHVDHSNAASAHESVSYVTKRFNGSFPMTLTEYQGEPSPELDAKWEELYMCTPSNPSNLAFLNC